MNKEFVYTIPGNEQIQIKSVVTNSQDLYAVKPSIKAKHSNLIQVKFTHAVNPQTALKPSAYKLNGSIRIDAVNYLRKPNGLLDLSTLEIKTTLLEPGNAYKIGFDKDLIVDLKNNKLSNRDATIVFYGPTLDIYPPKIERVEIKSRKSIIVSFGETSGLERSTAELISNYSITNIDVGKDCKILEVKVLTDPTNLHSNQVEVVLEENLTRLTRYILSVRKIEDQMGNEVQVNGSKGAFVLDGSVDQPAKLVNVEAISENLLKLVFDKPIFMNGDFKLEDVFISGGIKPKSIEADRYATNTLWLKTEAHTKSETHMIRLTQIEDYMGNISTYGECSKAYLSKVGPGDTPQIIYSENTMMNGENTLLLTFNKELAENAFEIKSAFSIKDLEVLYIYKISNHQFGIVTDRQVQNKPYYLSIDQVRDKFGNLVESNSNNAFYGVEFK